MASLTIVPAKPRIIIAVDGRTPFPDVVLYRVKGELHALPPRDGRSYWVLVQDLARYEEMKSIGQLGMGHAYMKPPKMVDQRAAPKG